MTSSHDLNCRLALLSFVVICFDSHRSICAFGLSLCTHMFSFEWNDALNPLASILFVPVPHVLFGWQAQPQSWDSGGQLFHFEFHKDSSESHSHRFFSTMLMFAFIAMKSSQGKESLLLLQWNRVIGRHEVLQRQCKLAHVTPSAAMI